MLQLARFCLRSVPSCFHQIRCLTKSKYDPLLVEQLTKKMEDEKTFKDIELNDFKDLFAEDKLLRDKVSRIINIYDNMKYNLEDVPSTLTHFDLKKLLEVESTFDISRLLKKLCRKEADLVLRKELQKHSKPPEEKKSSSSNESRAGIFDSNGQLCYGLWHNTLFTRIPKINQTRFGLDRLRNSEQFGQNLYLDMSFSKHLNYHVSHNVANDLGQLLSYNRYNLKEPFKITLCGVDYDHHLWKALSSNFPSTLGLTNHTEVSYLDLCSRRKLIYITCMENRSFLEYDPEAHYVMAAISERDIQNDFLTPQLKKLNVKLQGIPIDQHILWNEGSKRLNLNTKIRILNDIRNNKSWKETLLDNISNKSFKTNEQIIQEDLYRSQQLQELKKKKKKRKHNSNT